MKYLFSIFLIASALSGFGQLNKDETIKYIQDKINETLRLKKTYDTKYTYVLSDLKFKTLATNPRKIQFQLTRSFSDDTSDNLDVEFMPKYIRSIEKQSINPGDGITYMLITFSGYNVVNYFKSTKDNITRSTKDYILIPVLAEDQEFFERLKKAFLHLQNLYLQDEIGSYF